MRLSVHDFFIVHKSDKTNLTDASLRRSNYRNENTTINRFLLILQQKLTRIKSLNHFIFKVIRNVYKSRKIKDVKKTAVYNVKTENVKKTAVHDVSTENAH